MDDRSNEPRIARRAMVKRVLSLTVLAAVAPATLAACGGGELACDDVSGLSPADRSARDAAQYRDRSADPSRRCAQCTFFQAAGDQCGSCTVVRGPIHPEGTCQLFAPRT